MKKVLISAAVIGSLISCRPTEILQSGPTKFYSKQELGKTAVIAFPGELQDVRVFENTFASRAGKDVVAAYKLFEDKESIPSDAAGLKEELRKMGYNSVFEIKLVSIRQEEINTEANYPSNRFYSLTDVNNYGKLVQEYGKRKEKGAVFEDTKVKMDFRLTLIQEGGGQVIWSARTETSNPKTAKKVASGMSGKVIRAMKKDHILK